MNDRAQQPTAGHGQPREVEKEGVRCSARVTSSVVFVAEIGRSVEFYRDIFSCEARLETPGAALLLDPGGFQVYVIAKGSEASHHLGGIGVQYLMWAVETAGALSDLEQAIKDRGGRTSRTYTYASGGVSFLETRDPDGIRILVAFPSPERLPRWLVENRLYS